MRAPIVVALALISSPLLVSGDADPAFPQYGNFAIMPDSFPGIVGLNTQINVLVLNEGDQPANQFDVELSFNDWEVTYQGWQPIDTRQYGIPAIPSPGNEKQTFSHVFANRAHTCLQAVIVNTAENENTNNDRTQINWEVVHADEDYDMWVPFGNAADQDIIVNGTEISCFKNGSKVDCFPGHGEPGNPDAKAEPILRGAPGMDSDTVLGANEETLALVRMPKIPDDGMVVLVEASMNGELNHVMINVVKTSVLKLLNSPHLCCIQSIKTRVLLESVLADALDAYEAGNCRQAIKLLRMFVQKAILLECELSDEEIACIEKAILKIVDAGIMIARELSKNSNAARFLQEAHFFRRAGLYEAALLEAAKAC